MVNEQYKRLEGSGNLRQRLVLSTLSSTPILVRGIRSDAPSPGLRLHEISLLRLVDKVCDDSSIEINETGTQFRYKPGVVMGGRHLVHDCGTSRSIGYFLEPLVLLAFFGKKPLSIKLKGITNDPKDPSVDFFNMATLHIFKHFGVPSEGLELKIEKRGVPPLGGGEVILSVPIVQRSLSATTWIDEGMVKRIRGVTFCTGVSAQFDRMNRTIYAARGIFNKFIPDVFISIDSGHVAGRSPGYGISVVAETTSGCYISADDTVCQAINIDDMEDSGEKADLMVPEDLGVRVASLLLEEIEQGGVVDSTNQIKSRMQHIHEEVILHGWGCVGYKEEEKLPVAETDVARGEGQMLSPALVMVCPKVGYQCVGGLHFHPKVSGFSLPLKIRSTM